jgi:uncharacterized membrane protein (UPF0127 family)
MRMQKVAFGILAAGALVAGACLGQAPAVSARPSASPLSTASASASPAVATIPVTIKGHTVQVEMAFTEAEQALGLMHRTAMPMDRGMLFVFPKAEIRNFWMRNTRIPLSIAYIDADKVIVNIRDMQPLDEETQHLSSKPVPYALEVNQGWFASRGIVAGDVAEFTIPPLSSTAR